MVEQERDDWDRHWNDFSASSEMGPATGFRHKVCMRMLAIRGSGDNVRLLDIGSGTGGFAQLFCAMYPHADFHGVEMSEAGTKLAAQRVPNATFEQRDLLNPSQDKQIRWLATHAVCSEVLEHLDDPATLLRNARAYMAPGCRLVVTVPGGSPNAFDLYIGHRRHYTPQELRKLLEQVGFQVELSTGVGFPFFNLYRMLTSLRGERLKQDVAGKPSRVVRVGTLIFGTLFRLNSLRVGWQTVAVAKNNGN